MKPVIDVHYYRRQINAELEGWLKRIGQTCPVRLIHSRYDLCMARRQCVENFLSNDVPAGYTHLIQMDDDCVPLDTTDNILTAEGDLVYCSQPGRNGHRGHWGDGDFGCGCCRISAELAAKVGVAASFDLGLNPSRTKMVKCECHVFRDRARELGYESKMVGDVGHYVEVVIAFDPYGKVIQRWPKG
jgi:hypothetical protein